MRPLLLCQIWLKSIDSKSYRTEKRHPHAQSNAHTNLASITNIATKPIWLVCARDVPCRLKEQHIQWWVAASAWIPKDAYLGHTKSFLICSLYAAMLLCCPSRSTHSHKEIKETKSKVIASKYSPVYLGCSWGNMGP